MGNHTVIIRENGKRLSRLSFFNQIIYDHVLHNDVDGIMVFRYLYSKII